MLRGEGVRDFAQALPSPLVCSLIKRRQSEAVRRRPTHRDTPFGNAPRLHHARYHSFAEVIGFLNGLALGYPDRVQVQPIGTTHEGRQIPLIKVCIRATAAATVASRSRCCRLVRAQAAVTSRQFGLTAAFMRVCDCCSSGIRARAQSTIADVCRRMDFAGCRPLFYRSARHRIRSSAAHTPTRRPRRLVHRADAQSRRLRVQPLLHRPGDAALEVRERPASVAVARLMQQLCRKNRSPLQCTTVSTGECGRRLGVLQSAPHL